MISVISGVVRFLGATEESNHTVAPSVGGEKSYSGLLNGGEQSYSGLLSGAEQSYSGLLNGGEQSYSGLLSGGRTIIQRPPQWGRAIIQWLPLSDVINVKTPQLLSELPFILLSNLNIIDLRKSNVFICISILLPFLSPLGR